MLDMDAMTLAVVRDRLRTGRKPARDVVLAFVADEEAGGVFGAQWLVNNHPGLFDGCTEAISEVGGFSLSVNDDLRLYMIETAQKGMAWTMPLDLIPVADWSVDFGFSVALRRSASTRVSHASVVMANAQAPRRAANGGWPHATPSAPARTSPDARPMTV